MTVYIRFAVQVVVFGLVAVTVNTLAGTMLTGMFVGGLAAGCIGSGE